MNGKISTAVFLGFTALALSQSGCIIDASPSDSGTCFDSRYVSATWSIDEAANHSISLSCEQVPASTVFMDIGTESWSFPCNAYNGRSDSGLSQGTYSADLQLVDAGGNVLSTTPVVSIYVPSCAPVNLGNVVFDVN